MVLQCLKKRGPYGRWVALVFILFILSQFLINTKTTVSPYVQYSGDSRQSFETVVDLNEIFERDPDDPELISYVRAHLIEKLSLDSYKSTEYSPENRATDQSIRIDNYLKRQTNGTFVDIGPSDGVKDSMTLFFERQRNWSGLLIEPDATKYDLIKQNRKGVSAANTCVRTNEKEQSVTMDGNTIRCLWIKTILRAFKSDVIDLLSIDVNGQEMDILKSLPYEQFYIRVISVEFSHKILPELSHIYQYMYEKGYQGLHQAATINKIDVVFANMKNKLELSVS